MCSYMSIEAFSLDGFPHSESHGSLLACSSPWIIAAYRVFLRLLVPRHSPYALRSLIVLLALFALPVLDICLYFFFILLSMFMTYVRLFLRTWWR